ncbi:hypothetical protein GGI12_003380 [Dipsacomyces acuminosporus]|nr:hypothetical protein GGI12_003380 [Dipsacomyces acuminosporus]
MAVDANTKESASSGLRNRAAGNSNTSSNSNSNSNNGASGLSSPSPSSSSSSSPSSAAESARRGEENNGWQSIWGFLRNVALALMVFNISSMLFGGKQNQVLQQVSNGDEASSAAASGTDGAATANEGGQITFALAPYWKIGEQVSLRLYISEAEVLQSSTINGGAPEWQVDDILYGDTSINYEVDFNITATEHIQNNGTLYAHALFSRKGYAISPADPNYDADSVSVITWPLTYYIRYRKPVHVKKLVEFPHKKGSDGPDPEEVARAERLRDEQDKSESEMDGKLISYWYPNLTLAVVDAGSDYFPYGQEPPQTHKWIKMSDSLRREAISNLTYYKPIFFVNDFWRLQDRMFPINETVSVLPMHVQLNSMSLWKFRIYCTLDHSAKQQQTGMFGEDLSATGMDDFKRMLADTNPVLLAVTFTVTILHSLFDFLAFKNDVQFWRKKKDTVGVSVRTMLMHLAFEVIILLYLFDNREGTSYMILISNAVGVAIEAWKVVRALDLKVVKASVYDHPNEAQKRTSAGDKRTEVLRKGGYVATIKAYEAMTEEESNTREYDQIAYRYLSYVAYPLLLAYAIYALFTKEQKSWYSFVLSVLVGYVYTFGFMMMVPQLYINYRLKSVAHMPWRTFAYKALSTFIDDLFSWVMKMPWLHRLATLRDDVVFIIYLYQRYIYRVDHSRANEYGQIGEEAEQAEQAGEAGQAGEADEKQMQMQKPQQASADGKDAASKKND